MDAETIRHGCMFFPNISLQWGRITDGCGNHLISSVACAFASFNGAASLMDAETIREKMNRSEEKGFNGAASLMDAETKKTRTDQRRRCHASMGPHH